jgi:hypothetical protein
MDTKLCNCVSRSLLNYTCNADSRMIYAVVLIGISASCKFWKCSFECGCSVRLVALSDIYKVWSLTLREECRLRVFNNRVIRRIFGPKTDEVTGNWRRLHSKELCALHSSLNIIGVIK